MIKKISPAREAAYSILQKIDSGESNSAELIAAAQGKLLAADRALCHQIVLGTLRKQVLLDRAIDFLANGRKLDSEIRTILRLSLFQLHFLDRVPDYAVVNDAVNLCKKNKKLSAKGFINAILRRFIRDEVVVDAVDGLEVLSIETSHPRWLLEKWTEEFGAEEAAGIARANCIEPKLEYRLTPKGVARKTVVNSSEADVLIRLASDGVIYLQDKGSQMVGGLIQLERGAKFLDVCAAPGGKAGIISMNNPGALVVAADLSRSRVASMKEIFRRQDAEIPVMNLDAEKEFPFLDETFDCVLIDAPCTGTGTIRRNPEIALRITPSDLKRSAERQLKILNRAKGLVRSGGRLIYTTCSLEGLVTRRVP